jgi:hypothetical protein
VQARAHILALRTRAPISARIKLYSPIREKRFEHLEAELEQRSGVPFDVVNQRNTRCATAISWLP